MMFEDKDEVQKAVMELKLFSGMASGEFATEEDILDSTGEVAAQIFPEHDDLQERYCKTMYYGKLPVTDRPSLPLTSLAVNQFTNVGLDALGDKLGRLSMSRAAEMTRTACVGPSSLVLALLYLDRLRKRNPDYLTSISSADLFLVSMMVASKFLHDDGEEDEVFNDEWAQSGGMDTKEMNNLEINFLSAMDWRIFVEKEEFQQAVETIEKDISLKEVTERGWATYTELTVLSQHPGVQDIWWKFVELSAKMTAVCAAAYTAGFLSLLATAALLEKTPAGPSSVSSSVQTLSNCISMTPSSSTLETDDQTVPDSSDFGMHDEVINQTRVTAADILTASLLVTSLSSGIPSQDVTQEFVTNETEKGYNDDVDDSQTNYTRSLWLAEVSFNDGGDGFRNRLSDIQTGAGFGQKIKYQDFESFETNWKALLKKNHDKGHSFYTGRCPVLQWGSSLMFGHDPDLLGTLKHDAHHMSFIPLHG